MLNLLSNAIKFTPREGKVEASAVVHPDKVEIIIEDNGVGINQEILSQIQESEGYHFSSEGTSSEKGTGLGIMLAKDFVTMNKGTFSISSTPGMGTRISICLPKA